MDRRQFLKTLGAGLAVAAAPALVLPERKIWQVPATAPVRSYAKELEAAQKVYDQLLVRHERFILKEREGNFAWVTDLNAERYAALGYRNVPRSSARGQHELEMFRYQSNPHHPMSDYLSLCRKTGYFIASA